MGTRQTFKTTDVLRLEVEQTPTGLVNLVKNPPDTTRSPWGWITPSITLMTVDVASSPGTTWLKWSLPNTGPAAIWTEDWTQAAGQYAAARLRFATNVTAHLRLRFEWIDATGAVTSSAQSGYVAGTAVTGTGALVSISAQVAPAGTVRARLRLDFYGNTSGADTGSGTVWLREVTAAQAATSGPLGGLGYISPDGTYTNVLGATNSISVKRSELNVGTLTAEILDATLDPAVSTLIRPGKRCRLMALNNATATWEPVFTGKISRGETKYDPTRTDAKRARISLTAIDAISALAQVKRANGVATFPTMGAVLQGAGVPYYSPEVNTGITGYTTFNPNATALDQVAIVRDSVLGYAWVDRKGVLQMWQDTVTDPLPVTPVGTLSESKYSGLDLDYDTDRCINVVTVKLRRINPISGETEEVLYGPFVDQASIDKWGPHSAEFAVQGLTDTYAAANTYAAGILAANGTPAVRINAIEVPIRDAADIVPAKALLDLYDVVTTVNTNAAISQNMRVTGVEHRIEDGRWQLLLGFAAVGGVAPPTTAPMQGTPILEDSGEVLITPTVGTNVGIGYRTTRVTKVGRLVKLAGTLGFSGGVAANTVLFNLAAIYRPDQIETFLIRTSAGAGLLDVEPDGDVVMRTALGAGGNCSLCGLIWTV